MFSEIPGAHDMFNRPLDYPRDDLMHLYNALEDIKLQNLQQIEVTKKNMQQFGTELPQFSIDHAKTVNKALEVWMCTLGAGVAPDRRDDVREVWRCLVGSIDHVEGAIEHLKEIEHKTAEMTGTSDAGMFGMIDTNKWAESCHFVPAVFVKELKLDSPHEK